MYYKVLYPAFCDFLASFIMFVGLLWIPVSIWQMIRGSIILFTGLIRQYWLKKPLNKSEWTSLFIIFFSLILVGAAYFPPPLLTARSIFSEDTSASEPVSAGLKILGMFLVFIAQGIQALQTVIGTLIHPLSPQRSTFCRASRPLRRWSWAWRASGASC